MKELPIFRITSDGKQKEINWVELNQLKKDILWIYDENTNDLFNVFIPKVSFQSKYWEYLSLNGDKFLYEDVKDFYMQGVLIIILCMTIDYTDTESGNQNIFEGTEIDLIIKYVKDFEPRNTNQAKLKSIVISRLEVANLMTESDLMNKEYEHTNLNDFVKELEWVDSEFIKSYYKSLSI
ncbi:hypothetical protein [Flavobacterium sp. N1994]|uniref:hypothetical protein n=1 Tax=Flavobacterium sp. N1994 TaxID=2986827 RepID=UPI00222233AF|nr:hypothetical protein [Flavobacterium sp. N1994]